MILFKVLLESQYFNLRVSASHHFTWSRFDIDVIVKCHFDMLFSLTFRGFHQVPLCLLRQALRGQSIHPQWPALTDRRVSGYTHEGALQRYPAHIIINIHVATCILSSQTQPSSAVCWVCLPCHLPSLSLRLSSAIQIDMIAFKQPRYAVVTDTHAAERSSWQPQLHDGLPGPTAALPRSKVPPEASGCPHGSPGWAPLKVKAKVKEKDQGLLLHYSHH